MMEHWRARLSPQISNLFPRLRVGFSLLSAAKVAFAFTSFGYEFVAAWQKLPYCSFRMTGPSGSLVQVEEEWPAGWPAAANSAPQRRLRPTDEETCLTFDDAPAEESTAKVVTISPTPRDRVSWDSPAPRPEHATSTCRGSPLATGFLPWATTGTTPLPERLSLGRYSSTNGSIYRLETRIGYSRLPRHRRPTPWLTFMIHRRPLTSGTTPPSRSLQPANERHA